MCPDGYPSCHPWFSDWPVWWPPDELASPLIVLQERQGGTGTRYLGARMSDDPTASPKLQVQIDDDRSSRLRTQLTKPYAFVGSAFIQPSTGRAKVRTRVISSPRHTKRLLLALQKNLERYEERYGRIELSPDEEPMLH